MAAIGKVTVQEFTTPPPTVTAPFTELPDTEPFGVVPQDEIVGAVPAVSKNSFLKVH